MNVRYSHRKEPMHIDTSQEDAHLVELMRRANDVQGNRHYGDMAEANVPYHIRKGLIDASLEHGITNLDSLTERNAMGNLLRPIYYRKHANGQVERQFAAELRRDLFFHMFLSGFSYPEIAQAFFTSHSTIIHSLEKVKLTKNVE